MGGDDLDSLNLNGASWTMQEGVTIAGMESLGSFDHYTVYQGGQELHLYLQNVQLVW